MKGNLWTGLQNLWDNLIDVVSGATIRIKLPFQWLSGGSVIGEGTANGLSLATDKDIRLTDGSTVRQLTFANLPKSVCILVKDSDTDVAVGDGKDFFVVPASMNGLNLIGNLGRNYTAGTTGNHYIQVRRVRGSTPVDMLVGNGISIASGSTSGTGTIDTANDDIATGDMIFIDTDAIHTTPAKGESVVLDFGKEV